MKKEYLFIFITYLTFDLVITNLIIKKTNFWKNSEKQNAVWRIKSNIYSHDFKANVDVYEKWHLFNKRIITNSLGFRDFENKKVSKIPGKKRLYVIGDSFIEGAGYDYDDTVVGIINRNIGQEYEILNAGVSSYASGVYYLKTNKIINEGYKIDKALIFLDLSDIYDELSYHYSEDNMRIINHDLNKKQYPVYKKMFYKIGDILTKNTILFKTLLILSDQTEIFKNYIKLKYRASKEFNKNFFAISREEALFYRMLSIDRGAWTQNEDSFNYVSDGVKKTKFNLKRLFKLLDSNNIESTLIIYPWPNQIYYGDKYHQSIWEEFSNKNNINFISLYPEFLKSNAKETILENFILGDIHWNKKGNQIIANQILYKEFQIKKP